MHTRNSWLMYISVRCSGMERFTGNNESTKDTRMGLSDRWRRGGGDIEKLTIHHAFKMRAAHRKKFFSHGCSDKESKKRRRGPEERVENRWNVESEKLCRVRKEERETSLTPSPAFQLEVGKTLDCPRVLFKFAMGYIQKLTLVRANLMS